MYAILRVNLNQQMYMVRHNLEFNNFCLTLDANLVKQLLSSLLYVIFQDFSSIPKTPNNVVLTGINDLLVGLIFHIYIIQHTTLSVKQAFGLYPHT